MNLIAHVFIEFHSFSESRYFPFLASQTREDDGLDTAEVPGHNPMPIGCHDPVPTRFGNGIHGVTINQIKPPGIAVSDISDQLSGIDILISSVEVKGLETATRPPASRSSVITSLKPGATVASNLSGHGIELLGACFVELKSKFDCSSRRALAQFFKDIPEVLGLETVEFNSLLFKPAM